MYLKKPRTILETALEEVPGFWVAFKGLQKGRTKNDPNAHGQGIRTPISAPYTAQGLYKDTPLRVFEQLLEKGKIAAVAAAVGGQGPDTH